MDKSGGERYANYYSMYIQKLYLFCQGRVSIISSWFKFEEQTAPKEFASPIFIGEAIF